MCNHAFQSINQLENHQVHGCLQDPNNDDEEMADGGVIEEFAAGHETEAVVSNQQVRVNTTCAFGIFQSNLMLRSYMIY